MCSFQQSRDVSRLTLSGTISAVEGGLPAGEYMQESCMIQEEKVPIWKGESEDSKVESIYSSPVLSPGALSFFPYLISGEQAITIVDDLQVGVIERVPASSHG